MNAKHIMLAAVAAVALSASAAYADIATSQPGDAGLTCAQLSEQIGAMDSVISQAEGKATTSKVANAGFGLLQSIVPHFGIGGGAVGAMQATGAAATVAGSAAASSEQTVQQAQMRRAVLVGLHSGKACTGVSPVKAQEAAATEPAAGAAPAVATAPAKSFNGND